MLTSLFFLVVEVIAVFAVLMLLVLAMVNIERRVVAFMQTRVGPNRTGPGGLFQSLADGIKLFFKEDVVPAKADRLLFGIAPILILVPAFLAVTVIPFGPPGAQLTDLDIGLLFVLAMASLQVYGIVLAGYASGSNYPLLGGVRSSAQMISYEIAQGLSLVGVILYAGTLSLNGIVEAQQGTVLGFLPQWFVFPQFPLFLIFLIAGLAETNRAPFDLPEAESELVGGYHTEYSGIRFALFFLAEYLNMITVSAVAVTVFLGGPGGPLPDPGTGIWTGVLEPVGQVLAFLLPFVWFFLKLAALLFLFIWLRATMPRFRFDTLMALGWKVLIPVALAWVAVTAVIQVLDVSDVRGYLFAAAGGLLVLLLVALGVNAARSGRKPRAPRGTSVTAAPKARVPADVSAGGPSTAGTDPGGTAVPDTPSPDAPPGERP